MTPRQPRDVVVLALGLFVCTVGTVLMGTAGVVWAIGRWGR